MSHKIRPFGARVEGGECGGRGGGGVGVVGGVGVGVVGGKFNFLAINSRRLLSMAS